MTPKCPDYVPMASSFVSVSKRQIDSIHEPTLVAAQPLHPAPPVTRLVQNKQTRSSILVNDQSQFGTGQPITTASTGTSNHHPFSTLAIGLDEKG